MAKINGFEVKGLYFGKGHEDETIVDGNVYLKGKKIGEFRSSRTGGCMDIRIPNPENYKILNETCKKYIENFPEYFDGSGILWPESPSWFDCEMFILELVTIKDWEKIFKREVKKGAVSMVMLFNMEENRTTGRLFVDPVPAEYQPPKNHKLLRIITNLDQFNIAF